jgi:predicted CopG family antitoxin
MSEATIPVSREVFEKLNKLRYEKSSKRGKRVTWNEFLLELK